jgi:GntR family transcriptional regulator
LARRRIGELFKCEFSISEKDDAAHAVPRIVAEHVCLSIQGLAPVISCRDKTSVKSARARSDRTLLTREFGLPLYQQIHHLLRHRIVTGEYPAKSKIPSENELCRELAVSRVTVREALRELVHANMLTKVHGKGAFVAADTPRRLQTVKYAGFLEDLQERVLKLTVTDVEVKTVTAALDISEALELERGSDIVRIRRLRHIEGEPFSFTVNYLPVEIGARIRAKELYSVPLLRILQSELRIPIVRAQETIEAVPADPEVAQRLGISVLHPVMHMRRVMFTTPNRPFEVVETFYRADKYHYSVNLFRVKRKGKWAWKTEVETSAPSPM